MADTFKYFEGPYKKAYQNIDWKLRRASIQLLKTQGMNDEDGEGQLLSLNKTK